MFVLHSLSLPILHLRFFKQVVWVSGHKQHDRCNMCMHVAAYAYESYKAVNKERSYPKHIT